MTAVPVLTEKLIFIPLHKNVFKIVLSLESLEKFVTIIFIQLIKVNFWMHLT